MPELPDVLAWERYINSCALHQPITQTSVEDDRILEDVTSQLLQRRLKGHSLDSTSRRGKFLLIRVTTAGWLVLHFGMTGEMSYQKDEGGLNKYTRFAVYFENGYRLEYRSKRMLGHVGFTEDRGKFYDDHGLGPDALSDDVDLDRFIELMSDRRGAIKSTLMNQSILAGVGNVYSDEILFQAGVYPATGVDQLDERALAKIHSTMKRVLRVAADHEADVGHFPDGYLLKTRDEGICPRCGRPLEKLTVGGRTSYACPRCQPKPEG